MRVRLTHIIAGYTYALVIAAACLGILRIATLGYRNATAAPLVRQLVLTVPNYPANAGPIRIALFSDLHVHGPDMPPARVARIVEQINALHPDVVVSTGDFVGDNWFGARYSAADAIAPLHLLKARLGVFAVLGNNDYDAGVDDVRSALRRAGVRVLMNEATRVGPLALGGIDGRLLVGRGAWNSRRMNSFASLERTPGIKILLIHRPDEFKWTPRFVTLVLAGHTHCGQIVLPLIGPLETGSDFGRKYLCGLIRRGSQMLLVTAGVGTSHLPLRINAPPDIWLITIRSK